MDIVKITRSQLVVLEALQRLDDRSDRAVFGMYTTDEVLRMIRDEDVRDLVPATLFTLCEDGILRGVCVEGIMVFQATDLTGPAMDAIRYVNESRHEDNAGD